MALHSPEQGADNTEYDRSWVAINRLLRSGHSWSGHELNCTFLNVGNGRFTDVSYVSGLDSIDDGRGVAPVDWDGDGDLDLWMNYRSGPKIRFMRNDSGRDHHFLTVLAVGTSCNRDAIGARVELRTSTRTYIKTVRAGNNYMAQGTKWIHFGIGAEDVIEAVTVRWPDGTVSVHPDVPLDSRIRIVQGSSTVSRLPRADVAPKLTPSPLTSPEPTGVASLPLATRIPLADFAFEDFNGATHRISEFSGRPVLINLWATWCGPCIGELRSFVQDQEVLERSGVTLVALSVDAPEDRDKAKRTANDLGFWFSAGMCPPELQEFLEALNPAVRERYDALPLPVSLLLDRQGRVARLYLGPTEARDVAEDAGILNASDMGILNQATMDLGQITIPPGIWQLADIVMKKARWQRLLTLTSELLDRESYELASFYADELRNQLGVDDPPAAVRDKAVSAVASVANALLDRDPDRAGDLYRWVVEANPEDVNSLIRLTELLLQSGTPEALAEAAEAFDTALFYLPRPSSAKGFTSIGNTWLQLGRAEEAVPYLREANALDVDNILTRANLGLALLKLRQDEEGAPILEAAIGKLEPSAPNELALAEALDRIGAPDRAVAHYERYLELAAAPSGAAQHAKLSRVHIRLARWDEAAEDLHAALDTMPDNAALEWQLGAVLFAKGDATGALERLLPAIDRRPPSADNRALLGAAFTMNNQMDRAVVEYERALELEDGHIGAMRGLAIAHDALGEWDEAIAGYEAYLAKAPRDPEIVQKLGIAHEQLAHEAEAIAAYRALLQMDPESISGNLRLAMLLATASGDTVRDGEEALRIAVQLERQIGRESPYLFDLYAAAYAEAGRFDDAVRAAEEAIRLANKINNPRLAQSIESRLALYRDGKPFHRDK